MRSPGSVITLVVVALLCGPAAAQATTYDGQDIVAAPGEVNDINFRHDLLSPPNDQLGVGRILTQATAPLIYTGTDPNCFTLAPDRIECAGASGVDAWLGNRDDSAQTLIFGADARIHGGMGADVLNVNAAAAYAWGDGGDDTITIPASNGIGQAYGGAGDDRLEIANTSAILMDGDAGDDHLIAHVAAFGGYAGEVRGGGGNDQIDVMDGGSGPGVAVHGNQGNDTIDVRGGASLIRGGRGDDVIHADNGAAEPIACGHGYDSVTADADDTVAADCEDVHVTP
jgi:Ca2+-binding RTX toxin-like protein